MQKNRFWVIVICFVLAGGEAYSAIVTSTFLVPLRTAITDEIAFISSDATTSNAFALRPLIQARRAVDRRGRLSMSTELAQLAAASTVLLRSEYADLFSPLLDEAVLNYASALDTTSASLATALDALPQNAQVLSAQRSLDRANDLLDRAEASTNPEISTRLMSRVAVQFTALQASIARLSRTSGSTTGGVTALINSQTFTSDSGATANFNSGVGILTVSGSQSLGGISRAITVSLTGVRPGTTTHLLGSIGNGSYAIYSQRGTNSLSYTSVSGSATVTVDMTAQTVSGTFSFFGVSSTGRDAPLQVSSGTFNLPLR